MLWTIILFMFISIGRVQELIPIFNELYLGKIFGILMILVYILLSGLKNRITFKDSPEIVCIAGIFLFAFLSVPFGVWPRQSAEYLLNSCLKNFLFGYIIARTLVTTNQINKIVFVLIVTSMLLSVVALSNRASISRISAGQFYDPNDLAFTLICVLPFVVFGFFEEKGIKKFFLLLSGSLILTSIIFTRSRGGFIGLLVVGGLILFKTFKKSKLLTGLVLLGSIAVFTFLTPPDYWERMETIVEPGDDYNISSPSGRIEVWKRGFKLITEKPFTGTGIGNFSIAEGLSREDTGGQKTPWVTAHNSFIQIGGELGVGGLILFVLFIYYLFKKIRSFTSKDPQIKIFKDSLEVSLIGYFTGGFFLSQAYGMVLYLIAGMTIALNCIVKRSDVNHV
jgi:O-antigen ligase